MPRSITGTPLGRRPSRRRPLGAVALLAVPAAIAATLLTACSAGQVSQTDRMRSVVPGTNVDSPDRAVSLRNLVISYPGPQGYARGTTASLEVRIFNNTDTRTVKLTKVTATAGKGGPSLGPVTLVGGAPDVGGSPGPGLSASPGAASSASPSAPANGNGNKANRSPSVPASPPASVPPPSPGVPPLPGNAALDVSIEPGRYAILLPGSGGHLAIQSLAADLRPGSSVWLTFEFDGAAPVEIGAPVGLPLSPLPRTKPQNGH